MGSSKPGEIIITSLRPGSPPVIAVCDVQVGDLKIHGCTVRKGRSGSTFVNLPRQWRAGRWTPAVEITARDLLDEVRHRFFMAAMEATRYGILP